MLHLGGYHKSNAFWPLHMDFLDFFSTKGALFAHVIAFLEPLGGPQRSTNGPVHCSDAYPANIGQLDYDVVVGTKCGAV